MNHIYALGLHIFIKERNSNFFTNLFFQAKLITNFNGIDLFCIWLEKKKKTPRRAYVKSSISI